MTDIQQPSRPAGAPYRVLARKYRPATFAELVGQEAMVRTLTNAIRSGRLAQAYMLTGVRGVGKTTTARIIARALNCVGPDGAGGPTPEPCGACEHCVAIGEDRHVDVIEMDAASRTGVEDIRDLIDGVRYRPMSARYKVYVVDEVHMLSRNAFNALLKTLEEPPAHVKFVFATTEVRKVPVTVLSRCQRFDLRRLDSEALTTYLADIAAREGALLSPGAVALIARAADGSARDGLSLLDQSISTFGADGAGREIGEADVRGMLGLADRTQVFDLFDSLMAGDAKGALGSLALSHRSGADPVTVLQDLLELTHWVTRVKLVPEAADDPAVAEAERVRGRKAAEGLSMPTLARAWQMLLKGLAEAQAAPSAYQAAEMALIRLAHVAELPSPAEIVARLSEGAAPRPAEGGAVRPLDGRPAAEARDSMAPRETTLGRAPPQAPVGTRPRSALAPERSPTPEPLSTTFPIEGESRPEPRSFTELVALFEARREGMLCAHLRHDIHLVRFEPGRIEFRPTPHAPPDLANRLDRLLQEWTGRRWMVSVSSEPGAPTLSEQAAAAKVERHAEAAGHPLVKAVLTMFPGAEIVAINDLAPPEGSGAEPSEPEAAGAGDWEEEER